MCIGCDVTHVFLVLLTGDCIVPSGFNVSTVYVCQLAYYFLTSIYMSTSFDYHLLLFVYCMQNLLHVLFYCFLLIRVF